MEKNTELFIRCECGGHGIMTDYFNDEGAKEFMITPFGDKSYFEKPSLWWRIKASFKTLRTGWFPGGEVVLSRDNAKELKNHINRFIRESKIKLP